MMDQAPQLSDEINRLITEYYTDYYRGELGLPDWQMRVESRLKESANISVSIDAIQRYRNEAFGNGEKILVMGGGTGAELLNFLERGCDAVAIEPNKKACEIVRLKLKSAGHSEDRIIESFGEKLPFASDKFDFVWSHTVIEHVQNVEACLAEIIRVLKPLRHAYISTPDYRHFNEPHYKLPLPMFLPRSINAAILLLLRRPAKFIYTLQLVNTKTITNILQNYPVDSLQIVSPWPKEWKQKKLTKTMRLTKWIIQHCGYQRDQKWLLIKQEGNQWF